ncbi:CPBP family intramembrane glutamic endopeptidase [Anaerorhabdus sp.]|uniref:CPBP family intramembrane glutamic endopeptidase n=1 Tax=Anaerorhabdus sp. TaxID=1872524 RepID=UPI002FC92B43
MKTLSKKNAWLIGLNYGLGYLVIYPVLISWLAAFLYNITGHNYYDLIVKLFYATFFAVSLYLGRELFASAWNDFKMNWMKILKISSKNYLLSLLVSMVVSATILFMTNQTSSLNQSTLETQLKSTTVMIVLLSTVFAPLMEELFFRGLIYNKLASRFNFLTGAMISAILFGIMHVLPSITSGNFSDIPFALQYIVIGFFIARSYHQADSFTAPITFHFIQNTIATILLLLMG